MARLTNAERRVVLQARFDRINWSMRIVEREGFERVSVFTPSNTLVGVITMNEGSGYSPDPKHHDEAIRRRFYKIVDQDIGTTDG